MPTIVLETNAGDLLGFLLVAGTETLTDGPTERDCILTGVPVKAELFDHRLGSLIQERKQIEYRCSVSRTSDPLTLIVALSEEDRLKVEISPESVGYWHAIISGEKTEDGHCKLLKRGWPGQSPGPDEVGTFNST